LHDSDDWQPHSVSQVVGEAFCWRLDAEDSLLYPFRSTREGWLIIVMRGGPATPAIIDLLAPSVRSLWNLPTSPRFDGLFPMDQGWPPRATRHNATGSFGLFRVADDPPQVLWLGLAANAAVPVSGLALLFFVFWWLRNVSDWWRLRRRWRQLSRGRCPVCAYDIRHTVETRCPECGNAWRAEELSMFTAITRENQ
jgi:hypothetical protein